MGGNPGNERSAQSCYIICSEEVASKGPTSVQVRD